MFEINTGLQEATHNQLRQEVSTNWYTLLYYVHNMVWIVSLGTFSTEVTFVRTSPKMKIKQTRNLSNKKKNLSQSMQ
jgi:hypothetical protein